MKAIFAALAMAVLILDPKTALIGANEGIQLCIGSVVPSLFPFLVLSTVLSASLGQLKLLRPLSKWTGAPVSLLAVGFLGGYPVGAQAVATGYRKGQLTKRQAHRLLGFCSNCGPSFLFGVVASAFHKKWMPWALWGIHIFSALLVGSLLPGKEDVSVSDTKNVLSLPQALRNSIAVMAQICGWVVLFRVLLAVLNRWLLRYLPTWTAVLIAGLLELTNGCCDLASISSENLRFLLASVMLSFGGLCVTMQTLSVTEGLGLGKYLPGKLLQTAISLLLSWLVVTPRIAPVSLLAIFAIFLREIKKRDSIPGTVRV